MSNFIPRPEHKFTFGLWTSRGLKNECLDQLTVDLLLGAR
jgi:hypothetical protein